MHVTPLRIAVGSVLASAALIVGATSAFAERPIVSTAAENENIRSMAVSYADLNLMTEDGVDRLGNRVRTAARSVCDVRVAIRPLAENMATRKCFNGAMERAGRDVQVAIANVRSGNQIASNEYGGQSIAVTSN